MTDVCFDVWSNAEDYFGPQKIQMFTRLQTLIIRHGGTEGTFSNVGQWQDFDGPGWLLDDTVPHSRHVGLEGWWAVIILVALFSLEGQRLLTPRLLAARCSEGATDPSSWRTRHCSRGPGGLFSFCSSSYGMLVGSLGTEWNWQLDGLKVYFALMSRCLFVCVVDVCTHFVFSLSDSVSFGLRQLVRAGDGHKSLERRLGEDLGRRRADWGALPDQMDRPQSFVRQHHSGPLSASALCGIIVKNITCLAVLFDRVHTWWLPWLDLCWICWHFVCFPVRRAVWISITPRRWNCY